MQFSGIFGPPNVNKLKNNDDVIGLIKAVGFKKDTKIRLEAIKALGEIGDDSAIDPLIATLKDESNIRLEAVTALGKIRDSRATDSLIVTLRDENINVRIASAVAFGEIGDSRAVDPLLIAASEEKNEVVRQFIAVSLCKLKWKPNIEAVYTWFWIYQSLNDPLNEEWKNCVTIGEDAIDFLIATLNNRQLDKFVRAAAIKALGEIRDKRAVESLIKSIKSPLDDSIINGYAAEALGKIKDEKSVEPLITFLNREKNEIQRKSTQHLDVSDHERRCCFTAEALGRIGDPCAVEPLIAAMKIDYEKSALKESAIKALGEIGDTRAVDPLITALDDTTKHWYFNVRRIAAINLGQFGDPRAIGPLKKMSFSNSLRRKDGSEYDHYGDVFEKALDMIYNACSVEQLIMTLKESTLESRECVTEWLGKKGDLRAVEPLIVCIKDPNSVVRRRAIEALGKLGDDRAIEPIIGALEDENIFVRSEAEESLKKLGWTPPKYPFH